MIQYCYHVNPIKTSDNSELNNINKIEKILDTNV